MIRAWVFPVSIVRQTELRCDTWRLRQKVSLSPPLLPVFFHLCCCRELIITVFTTTHLHVSFGLLSGAQMRPTAVYTDNGQVPLSLPLLGVFNSVLPTLVENLIMDDTAGFWPGTPVEPSSLLLPSSMFDSCTVVWRPIWLANCHFEPVGDCFAVPYFR